MNTIKNKNVFDKIGKDIAGIITKVKTPKLPKDLLLYIFEFLFIAKFDSLDSLEEYQISVFNPCKLICKD